jgi:hypothetical protein
MEAAVKCTKCGEEFVLCGSSGEGFGCSAQRMRAICLDCGSLADVCLLGANESIGVDDSDNILAGEAVNPEARAYIPQRRLHLLHT